MDAFQTEEMKAVRRKARDCFKRGGAFTSGDLTSLADRVWRDLGISPVGDGFPAFSGSAGVSDGVLIIEEASFYRPRLGLDLMRRRLSGEAASSPEERLFRLARIIGTAAHIFEAGALAARDKGLFASSLMGFREVQESLAGLVSGVETLRLGACRVCHLLDHGERERGGAESIQLYDKALTLERDALSLALGLLGEAWTKDNIPEDESPSEHERNRL